MSTTQYYDLYRSAHSGPESEHEVEFAGWPSRRSPKAHHDGRPLMSTNVRCTADMSTSRSPRASGGASQQCYWNILNTPIKPS